MRILLSLLLISSNIIRPADNIVFDGITTSNANERAHIIGVTSWADKSYIRIKVDYYINTMESSAAIFTANSKTTTKDYSAKEATGKYDSIEIKLDNIESNTRVKFNFNISSAQGDPYTYGEFNFDNNTREYIELISPGNYSYDWIEGISFSNDSKVFDYETINTKFSIIVPRQNSIITEMQPFSIYGNIESSATVTGNEQVFYNVETLNGDMLNSGEYELELVLEKKLGGISKTVIINYKYIIENNYGDGCIDANYCLGSGGEISGTFEETKRISITT